MTTELKPCKHCGSVKQSWTTGKCVSNGIQQNRLHSDDVHCFFYLGCDDCSHTLEIISADQIAEQMNTRATPSPDVPEVKRYRLHWSDFDTADMEIDSMEGEYVLHSQAAEIIAADRATLEQAKKEINTLLVSYVREHFFENKTFQPLDSLIGQISQLDNAITITRDFKNRAEAAEAAAADLQAENERLREALKMQRKAATDYCWERYKGRQPMFLNYEAVFTSHEWQKIGDVMDEAVSKVIDKETSHDKG